MPETPGRLSMITGWPNWVVNEGSIRRTRVSTPPPAV
jgi:hypothetical protein